MIGSINIDNISLHYYLTVGPIVGLVVGDNGCTVGTTLDSNDGVIVGWVDGSLLGITDGPSGRIEGLHVGDDEVDLDGLFIDWLE